MPIYPMKEVLEYAELSAYDLYEELYEQKEQEREGLIYLFREWLDLVSPADFGNDEGLEGVSV
jgi:hypothetical protein